MSDKAWKQAERRGASFWGTARNALSGGNSKVSRSDSIDPEIFIESKQRESHAVWTLHDDTKKKAVTEGKIPLIHLFRKNSPGFMVCIHSDHFEQLATLFLQRKVEAEIPDYSVTSFKDQTKRRRRRRKRSS